MQCAAAGEFTRSRLAKLDDPLQATPKNNVAQKAHRLAEIMY
jgi:hypothetical protein